MGHPRFIDGNEFPAADWNGVMDAAESQSVKMMGRGILSGFALSDEGGFDLGIAAGWGNWLRTIEVDAIEYEVPPSVTRYVWIDEAGAVTLTPTTAYPGGQNICLGKFVSDGSGITSVSSEGAMYALWWSDERTLRVGATTIVFDNLNGFVGIGMVPTVPFESAAYFRGPGVELAEQADDPDPAEGIVQIYSKPVDVDGDEFAEPFLQHEDMGPVQLWRGHHRLHSTNVETIAANKQLTARDANVQVLTPSGSNRDVILPAFADIGWGDWFKIINPHASLSLVLKAHTDDGGATIKTITAGSTSTVNPTSDAGDPVWPSDVPLDALESGA